MAFAGPRPKRKVLLLVALAGVATAGPEFGANKGAKLAAASQLTRAAPAEQKRWEAAAPGRVESWSREIRISAVIVARIAEVLIQPADKVSIGDLLVRLEDGEALARLAAAEAQVDDRRRALDDQTQPNGSAERLRAGDLVADTERAVARARSTFDSIVAARRAGTATESDVADARSALLRAQDGLKHQREAFRKIKTAPDAPLPSRTEAALAIARAELTVAEEAVERTRIRAPLAGTVLKVQAKTGELTAPSSEQPLAVLGDLSGLRVRAELEERDIGKVNVGQRAIVRADAFRGRDFEGKVSSIALVVGPGRISARGPQKLMDVDVLEVVVDLTDAALLIAGMRVDVFFSSDK